jgi:hypothetical protein
MCLRSDRSTSPNPTNPYAPRQQQAGTGGANPGGTSAGGTGVAETLKSTAASVGDAASTVANRVEDAWDSASRGVRQGAEYMADKAGDFWGDFTGMIRRYPVASVLIAFGMGCLCASLFAVPNWTTDDVARRMSRSSA